MIVSVKDNQSVLDIAMQHSGTVEALFEIIKSNQLSDLDISGRQSLEVPTILKPTISKHYVNRNKTASTMPNYEFGGFSNAFSNAFNQ
jgi:hypothetical protein